MRQVVITCDRCRMSNVQVVQVLGRDLCVACQVEFGEWVDTGRANAVEQASERAGFGERFKQVEALCANYGLVTSVSLAKVSGLHRTQANWYLHRTAKLGRLVFNGKGVFTLPKAEAAE